MGNLVGGTGRKETLMVVSVTVIIRQEDLAREKLLAGRLNQFSHKHTQRHMGQKHIHGHGHRQPKRKTLCIKINPK